MNTTSDIAARLTRFHTIALDGCDGTGKSTLANELFTRHGYRVEHSMRSPDGVDLFERYRSMLVQPGPLVLDRCFIAELVYGPRHHGGSRLDLNETVSLARTVTQRDGVLVHLTGAPWVIHRRLIKRDGHAVDVAEVTALLSGYRQVFAQLEKQLPGRIMTFNIAGHHGGCPPGRAALGC